jgi:hypothetical protein
MSIGLVDAYVSGFFATLGVPFAEKALGFVLLGTGRLAGLAQWAADAGGQSRSAGRAFDRNRA